MRVLHLSIYDRIGGACIAAYRQHVALQRKNIDSRMWVLSKVTGNSAVETFQPPTHRAERLGRLTRRKQIKHSHRRAGLKSEFFDFRSEYGKTAIEGMPQADIINVQFPHDFVDFPSLYSKVPKTIPMVVTLHEMSPFTGGCSYGAGCNRYKTECGNCPQLSTSGPNDLSHRNWKLKRLAYSARRPGMLHFVADSHWIAERARESGLLGDYPVSVIHYGVDLEIFRPLEKQLARRVLCLPENRPIIGFAAASVENARKGIQHVDEALREMQNKPFVLSWGHGYPRLLNSLPHHHLGSVSDERLMALAYNACDVFVMPSLEEAFGQTALESIACGTPVVAFAAGGITDTVRHEETGLLARVGDSHDLCQAIERLLSSPPLSKSLGAAGRLIAEQEFSYERNAQQYVDLYHELLQTAEQNTSLFSRVTK